MARRGEARRRGVSSRGATKGRTAATTTAREVASARGVLWSKRRRRRRRRDKGEREARAAVSVSVSRTGRRERGDTAQCHIYKTHRTVPRTTDGPRARAVHRPRARRSISEGLVGRSRDIINPPSRPSLSPRRRGDERRRKKKPKRIHPLSSSISSQCTASTTSFRVFSGDHIHRL